MKLEDEYYFVNYLARFNLNCSSISKFIISMIENKSLHKKQERNMYGLRNTLMYVLRRIT